MEKHRFTPGISLKLQPFARVTYFSTSHARNENYLGLMQSYSPALGHMKALYTVRVQNPRPLKQRKPNNSHLAPSTLLSASSKKPV